MEPTTRQSDGSDPRRLVDVRFDAGPSLDLSGGLAGVLTDSGECSAAAGWIVRSMTGAAAVLGRDALRGRWQAVCASRRDELAAAHASRRLERHRIEAALERARAREVAPAPPAAPAASDALGLHVHSLLRAIDHLVPVPSLEALELADAWEVHTTLVRARANGSGVDTEAAEGRVSAARTALAMSSGGFTAEARAEIDRCHRALVKAEAEMFEAKRKARPLSVARYEAAVAAEKRALADAGVDSYAAFLFAITGGDTPDTDARRSAQQDLAAATAALDAARRGQQDQPGDPEFHARGVELRARAERLLGRVVVGGDPPAELRALRIEAPARAERVRLLTDRLRGAGIAVNDDAVASARRLLASKPPGGDEQSGQPATASGGREKLERQQAQVERALADLEAEIARLDALHEVDIGGIAPADVARIAELLLDAHRAGDVGGGRTPVVFDGAFDGLAPDACQAALLVLARTTEMQSIVVTDDVQVMEGVAQAGGTIVLWTAPTEPARGNAGLPSSQPSQNSQHSQPSRSSEA